MKWFGEVAESSIRNLMFGNPDTNMVSGMKFYDSVHWLVLDSEHGEFKVLYWFLKGAPISI